MSHPSPRLHHEMQRPKTVNSGRYSAPIADVNQCAGAENMRTSSGRARACKVMGGKLVDGTGGNGRQRSGVTVFRKARRRILRIRSGCASVECIGLSIRIRIRLSQAGSHAPDVDCSITAGVGVDCDERETRRSVPAASGANDSPHKCSFFGVAKQSPGV